MMAKSKTAWTGFSALTYVRYEQRKFLQFRFYGDDY